MLFALAGIVWLSYRFSDAYPGGEYLLGVWSGGRILLSEGGSPYSAQVQSMISEMAGDWGPSAHLERHMFRYPFFMLLLAMPITLIGDYLLARTLWMSAAILAIILLAVIVSRLVGWRPRLLSLVAASLLILFNPYTTMAVVAGDFAVITLLLAALALLATRSELDELAGLLLAFSMITPQLVLPLLTFVTVWGISHRRDRLLLWTYGGLGLLIAGSWLVQRDWILGYLRVLGQYYRLGGIFTPGQALRAWWPGFGAQMGWILTVVLGLLLLNEWRLAYGKGPRWFLWTACLTLAAGPLLGLRTDPSSLVITILPLIFVIGLWDQRWGGRYGWSTALILLFLFLGLWALVPRGIDVLTYPGVYPVLFFALPIPTIIGLYWVRWLAVRPRSLVMDELRKRGDL
jgi:hypothetical protein